MITKWLAGERELSTESEQKIKSWYEEFKIKVNNLL
jgi:hypothetical protein